MAIFKCKMCGGNIEFEPSATVGVCDSCGTKQTLPRLDDDKKANLYDRANHFRRNNDFDKAMGIYEQILNEDGTDAEAYWSLVLCRYGVEYVEDPATHRRVPTVNRAQFTSVLADEDYKAALAHADTLQKSIYEAEAHAIDEIQKGILEISQKEEPFDVFICYKETDANGRRTQDSVLATELYHELVREGFKVFFSRITLEDKLGTAYEPYIFAALNSSKVMVVLGTKPEHFNAVWVKNEWSRYLALIKNGARKMLIPAYRDMDPYDLPEEFSHLQAQDMSKLGFMQDLVHGIKKIAGSATSAAPAAPAAAPAPIVASTDSVAPLLKRGFFALEDRDWKSAEALAERALDADPECAEGYLIRLLASVQVPTKEELKNSAVLFGDNPNYLKTVRFADEELKKLLEESEAQVCKSQQEKLYSEAEKMSFSDDIETLKKAKGILKDIANYKNAKELMQICDNRIIDIELQEETAKQQKKKLIVGGIIAGVIVLCIVLWIAFGAPLVAYNNAIDDYNNGYYQKACQYFANSTYKDSEEMTLKCKYGYVKSYFNNNDPVTYEYMKELKKLDYEDSADLFEELYAWKAEIEACTEKGHPDDAILSELSCHGDNVTFTFKFTGGEPGEIATFYSVLIYPNGYEQTSPLDLWEDLRDGDTQGSGWGEDWNCPAGTFRFNVYETSTKEKVGGYTVTVK